MLISPSKWLLGNANHKKKKSKSQNYSFWRMSSVASGKSNFDLEVNWFLLWVNYSLSFFFKLFVCVILYSN